MASPTSLAATGEQGNGHSAWRWGSRHVPCSLDNPRQPRQRSVLLLFLPQAHLEGRLRFHSGLWRVYEFTL
jgi:hypothetical protein